MDTLNLLPCSIPTLAMSKSHIRIVYDKYVNISHQRLAAVSVYHHVRLMN